jgi:hypothetical protein
VNILDEDIDFHHRQPLSKWRIQVRQIGVEVGRTGMSDLDEILPLLPTRRRPTSFTQDQGFYDPTLHHPR